ncbi:MAG TPA: hypothetical protein PKC09_08235 [Paracoccus sp. (in: a-proteobacteria)]|uniref:hypothetical protein n=1 Tax=uncultured Paracoccus sp. TaxID=189685 RepID=UPI00260F0764|nr:hypothetical protein [uncultured Paracoccus sp.]HMQ41246.1 hypothetical protein [Paracoccus sp. (in: a-proteobacteria)]HMR37278.1 hypothetical protein [Paracoccus sp. (in: a-proteobacteria)]
MLIFWDQRLVFLATPKAGSTAVEVALEPLASLAVQRPHAMKHVNATQFRHHLQPWLREIAAEDFTTVALMREPVEWLRSWYRFELRDSDADQLPDFEHFTRRYLSEPGAVTNGIGTQSAFLGGETPVDRIFRYEDIDAFTAFLDDRLGCEIVLPRVNVPPAADVTLSPATEAQLRETLRQDILLYESLS